MSLKHSPVVKLLVVVVVILLLNLLLGYSVVSYYNINPAPVLQVYMYKRFSNKSNQSTTSSLVYTSQTPLETIIYPSNNISTTNEHEYINEYSQTNPSESVNIPQCNCSVQNQLLTNSSRVRGNLMEGDTASPTIFVVTATYTRYTQRADLISLCHTLMLVPNVVWIVIEDSHTKTNSVSQLLKVCVVQSVHLNAVTNRKANIRPGQHCLKGVMQRNAGLQWLRSHYRAGSCSGVVYFADDDNRYDLRLFEEIRQTRTVSVFKVAFVGELKFEGPICSGQKVVSWHSAWGPRAFPIDMAGFAINLWLVLAKPTVLFGRKVRGGVSRIGYLETDFLEHFTTRASVECRGSETEVYVWHTHTSHPSFDNEKKVPSNLRVQLRR